MQMMREKEFNTMKIVFMEEENIGVYDFQYFLKQFNIVYLKALAIERRLNISDSNYLNNDEFFENLDDIKSIIYPIHKNENRIYIQQLHTSTNDLVICEIDKHSPMKIIFSGSILALTVAIILSGGKINVDVSNLKFEATINKTLGEAIIELRRAFK